MAGSCAGHSCRFLLVRYVLVNIALNSFSENSERGMRFLFGMKAQGVFSVNWYFRLKIRVRALISHEQSAQSGCSCKRGG